MKKEIYVSFILDQIRSGNIKQADVMALCGTKFNMPERTFKRYWKIAQEQHKALLSEVNNKKDDLYINHNLEDAEKGILTAIERKKILSDIAIGEKARRYGDNTYLPSDNERIAAIKQLNIMCGDNAPVKIDSTTTIIDFSK